MKKSFLILFFLICFVFESFQPIKIKSSGQDVKNFKILGERCSGTNFISTLMEKNLEIEKNFSETTVFGHKHFIAWIGHPMEEEKINSLLTAHGRMDPRTFFFQNSDDCLFVVVVRNPYDWIRSWYHQKHHINPQRQKSFFEFFGKQYKFFPMYGDAVSYLEDEHPQLKRGFKNLFELRKYKYENYLKLFDVVKNIVFVKYEDVFNHQEDFLEFLSHTYKLQKVSFRKIEGYKGISKKYVAKQYSRLSYADLAKMNGLIDWNLETQMGYKKISCLKYAAEKLMSRFSKLRFTRSKIAIPMVIKAKTDLSEEEKKF